MPLSCTSQYVALDVKSLDTPDVDFIVHWRVQSVEVIHGAIYDPLLIQNV